tara:strand:+ start:161 stop:496 length:336 start_codon:yes stop_codon:yes gene_type:complete
MFSEETQTFKLKDGTKVIGTIISEDNLVFEVETSLGLVQIEKKSIKKSQWKVFMNDGTVLVGNKMSASENEMILNTDIGVFKIKKDDYFIAIPILNNKIYFGLMFVVAIFT